MASVKQPNLHGTTFQAGSDMATLWSVLRDQRRHGKADLLKKLKAQDKAGRLAFFVQHGQFPRANQKYRWITHDDGKLICIEISVIEAI
jgi:hypothetical protein